MRVVTRPAPVGDLQDMVGGLGIGVAVCHCVTRVGHQQREREWTMTESPCLVASRARTNASLPHQRDAVPGR
jgi:hypothetical protein